VVYSKPGKGVYQVLVNLFHYRTSPSGSSIPFTIRVKQGPFPEKKYSHVANTLGESVPVTSFYFDPASATGIAFATHIRKYNPEWAITLRPPSPNDQRMKIAWLLVRQRLCSNYGLVDTTPKEWEDIILLGKVCLICFENWKPGDEITNVCCSNHKHHVSKFHDECIQSHRVANSRICALCGQSTKPPEKSTVSNFRLRPSSMPVLHIPKKYLI